MINILLISPLILALLIILVNRKWFCNIAVLSYSFLCLACSVSLYLLPPAAYVGSSGMIAQLFQFDGLNSYFFFVMSLVFAASAIYNIGYISKMERTQREYNYYSIGIIGFVFSMIGALLSTNLGLSWVFIEATTLSSAYLIYFSRSKHALEAVWKFVFICSIGISLAFVGIVLLLIGAGSHNSLFFKDLFSNALMINPFWLKIAFVFYLVGIGTKMGLAPVHSWLPDAHSEAPSPISAMLSAAMLNTAFFMILKMFSLMEIAKLGLYAKSLMLIMGLLSLFVSAVFILIIKDYKRMLAYSSIENMGIMAIGVSLGNIGIFAALVHLFGHSIIKTSIFLTSGNVQKIFRTKATSKVSGILKVDRLTGWLLILSFIGIAGLPPSPLFLSELLLLKALLANRAYILIPVIFALLTTVIFGMGNIIIRMAFGEKPGTLKEDKFSLGISMYLPQIILIFFAFIIGIYLPQFLQNMINIAVATIGS